MKAEERSLDVERALGPDRADRTGLILRRLVSEYYHPWPNQAGCYLARADGRYTESGLDLDIGVTDPGWGDALDHLARRDADYVLRPDEPADAPP